MKPENYSSFHHEDFPEKVLKTLGDVIICVFDENRKILYTNKNLPYMSPGSFMGAAQSKHFEEHQYFDESGNQLNYPQGSAVDLALHGVATHNLILEHRNKKDRKHSWISISCIPVLDAAGRFQYGI